MILKDCALPFALVALLGSQAAAQETLREKPRLVLEAEISGAWARIEDNSLQRRGAAGSLHLNLRSSPAVYPLLIASIAHGDIASGEAGVAPASVTELFLLGGVRWTHELVGLRRFWMWLLGQWDPRLARARPWHPICRLTRS